MRSLVTMLVVTLLAGCADNSPLEPPTYEPPQNRAGFNAFKKAMKADWLEKPFEVGEAPSSVNALNYQKSADWNRKQIANKDAKTAYGALRRVVMGDCAWRRVKRFEVPKWAEHRVSERPPAAYDCSFTAHYRINPPHGKKLSAEAKGLFFKDDGSFVFLGRFAHPY